MTPSSGANRPSGRTRSTLDELNRRKRAFVFSAAAAALAVFLLLPVLGAFTAALDGIVGSGLSRAYLLGFAQFAVALIVAHVYAARAKRFDALAERAVAELKEPGDL